MPLDKDGIGSQGLDESRITKYLPFLDVTYKESHPCDRYCQFRQMKPCLWHYFSAINMVTMTNTVWDHGLVVIMVNMSYTEELILLLQGLNIYFQVLYRILICVSSNAIMIFMTITMIFCDIVTITNYVIFILIQVHQLLSFFKKTFAIYYIKYYTKPTGKKFLLLLHTHTISKKIIFLFFSCFHYI